MSLRKTYKTCNSLLFSLNENACSVFSLKQINDINDLYEKKKALLSIFKLWTLLPYQLTYTYPKVFPALDLIIEGVSWTRSVHHLPVALQSEVGLQVPTANCTHRKVIPDQAHHILWWQTIAVVSNEGDTEAYGVMAEGVGSLPEPASALIQVAIGACNKALTAPWVFNYLNILLKVVALASFTCIRCHPSLCPPGGSAAWNACPQRTVQ